MPSTVTYGGKGKPVTIGTGSTEISAEKGQRKYALIQNDSAQIVYINIGQAALMNNGIRLAANGGFFEMSPHFGNLSQEVINGISATGSAVVLLTEAA